MTENRRIHIAGLLPFFARSLPKALRDYVRVTKSGIDAESGSLVLPPEHLLNFGFLEKKYLSLHAPVSVTLVAPKTAKFDDLIQRLFFIFDAELIKSGAVQPVSILVPIPDEVFKMDDEDFYFDFFGAVTDAVECLVDQEFEILYTIPAFTNSIALINALARLNGDVIPKRQVHCQPNGVQIQASDSDSIIPFARSCTENKIPLRVLGGTIENITAFASQINPQRINSFDVADYKTAMAITKWLQSTDFQRSV